MPTLRSLPIQLSEAALGSKELPAEVQILRTGAFTHPKYGKFSVTADTLLKLKENFDAEVRGVDIAIDYSHESDQEAAGWIQSLSLKEDNTQLWAVVRWTPKAEQKLKDREFRYLSADFTMDFKNNETLQSHGPTLLGAGLTNRPVIKEMAPVIELSEDSNPNEETVMEEKIKELEAKVAELTKMCEDLKAVCDSKDMELGDMKKKLAEQQGAAQKLEEEKKCAEKKSKFDLLLSEGKAVEAQREAFMGDDMAKFIELAQPLKLSENGNEGNASTGAKTAQDEVLELAEAKAKSEKLSIDKAISLVLSEKSDLRKRYEEEVGA